jgi:NAD-dependent deacetylase
LFDVVLHEKRELYTMVAARLTPETRITVLTGAGVSAASGVPTFRGAGGLWRNFRPEELATPRAFARDPRLVWEWYNWRRGLIGACRPNRAHDVLAVWSRRFPHFTLITQNVDGLHEAAGTRDVVRMHGSIWDIRCARPCPAGATPWRHEPRSSAADAARAEVPLPECPHCGGLARPAVIWFGEMLDPAIVARAAAATACEVFFAVGTSAVVYPAAGLLHEAKENRAFTVEINPDVTDASRLVDVAIAEPAEVALDAIDAMIETA